VSSWAPACRWSGAKSEIREALTNLVFNAVDAMPQGGRLTLRTRSLAADKVCVEVSDTGVGMDEETRRRCLEPFFTTKGERGTGLGLAMVYGVMQRHGGDLEIESRPGDGTTVRLSFVAAATDSLAATETHAALPFGLTCCWWMTTRSCCDRCARRSSSTVTAL
jgi:signal transduction histidine kinase